MQVETATCDINCPFVAYSRFELPFLTFQFTVRNEFILQRLPVNYMLITRMLRSKDDFFVVYWLFVLYDLIAFANVVQINNYTRDEEIWVECSTDGVTSGSTRLHFRKSAYDG